jgi:SAM-dependent methyltransferase
MHGSVLEFLKKVDPKEIEGKYVVEFGALNVNGSARDILMPMKPAVYEGYDMIPGPGVDRVTDFSMIARLVEESEKPDVMVCLNTLEHCKNWSQVVRNIKHLLKRGGLFLFSVPSLPYPWHNPPDYWRFSLGLVSKIFADMKIEEIIPDPEIPGVMMRARAMVMTGTVPLCEFTPDETVQLPGRSNYDFEKAAKETAKSSDTDWEDI